MSSDVPFLPGATVLEPMNKDEPKRSRAGADAGKQKQNLRPTRDRFGVLNAFVDAGMIGLSRAELATWLVLYRDTRNGTARTSGGNIAQRIGTSRRTVVEALGNLRRRGLLTVVYRGGLNRGPSIYRVHPLPKEPAH